MSRRVLWIVLALAVGVLGGRGLLGFGGGTPLAPTPALAGNALSVEDGQVFVTADGASVYLWRRAGDRITLLGQCARTEEGTAAATFVWMPGVERES